MAHGRVRKGKAAATVAGQLVNETSPPALAFANTFQRGPFGICQHRGRAGLACRKVADAGGAGGAGRVAGQVFRRHETTL